MTVTENEYEDYARTEPSQPVTSDVVRGDYKSVEVDESTGGGLVSSNKSLQTFILILAIN